MWNCYSNKNQLNKECIGLKDILNKIFMNILWLVFNHCHRIWAWEHIGFQLALDYLQNNIQYILKNLNNVYKVYCCHTLCKCSRTYNLCRRNWMDKWNNIARQFWSKKGELMDKLFASEPSKKMKPHKTQRYSLFEY